MKKNGNFSEEQADSKEQVEDLETYIEQLSTFLPLAVCTLSSIGIIVDSNQAFLRLGGFNSLNVIGKPFALFFSERQVIEQILKNVRERGSVEKKEVTLLSENGKKIPVSLSLGPRKDRKGRLVGFFASVSDITDEKELQARLEHKVRERTQELQERIEEMEKFQRLTVGRELKMMRLKEEIKKLKKRIAQLEKKS